MLAHPHRRVLVGAVAALMVAGGVVAGAATPAQAHSLVPVICTGEAHHTLTPGLRNFPQTITTVNDHTYTSCGSLFHPSPAPGASSTTVVAEFSCTVQAGLGGSGTETIHWKNKQSSTFEYDSTFATVAGQFIVTYTGTITDGLFEGAHATEVIVGPTLDVPECLAEPGLTHRDSKITLTILP